MIINTTLDNLQNALDKANGYFNGNLAFNNLQRLSDNRYRVTLRVKDSHGKGARLGTTEYDTHGKHISPLDHYEGERKRKHLISACWHAHGTFFDNLPQGTRIATRGNTTYSGSVWEDFNVGTQMFPLYLSEACECNS